MQLTFNIEQKAIDAKKQIWINYVKAKFQQNQSLVGTGTEEYSSLDGLNNNELNDLKVYGINPENKVYKNQGITTEYVLIGKAKDMDKWFFRKPDADLLADVVDYSEEVINMSWFPQSEEEAYSS
jgi:hypothetical protein